MLTNLIYAGAYVYGKDEDRGRPYPQICGPSQAAKRMEGLDQGPSSQLASQLVIHTKTHAGDPQNGRKSWSYPKFMKERPRTKKTWR